MKTTIGICLAVLTFLSLALADDKAPEPSATFTDQTYGYTIDAPAFPKAPQGTQVTRVIMLGPAENRFASNVNVIVQQVQTSRDQVRDTSLQQFKNLGLTVTSHRNATIAGKDAVIFDSQGKQQGRDLRFLSAAVIDTNRVFVITCTTPQELFDKHKKAFEDCINSFKLTGS